VGKTVGILGTIQPLPTAANLPPLVSVAVIAIVPVPVISITATGTIQKADPTVTSAGTHLLVNGNQVLFFLKSETINLNDYTGKQVTVGGTLVIPFGSSVATPTVQAPLIALIDVTKIAVFTPPPPPTTVTAEGIISRVGPSSDSVVIIGTHVLKDKNGAVEYGLLSETIKLDGYVGQHVKVTGTPVPLPFALGNLPISVAPTIDVTKVEVIQ